MEPKNNRLTYACLDTDYQGQGTLACKLYWFASHTNLKIGAFILNGFEIWIKTNLDGSEMQFLYSYPQ